MKKNNMLKIVLGLMIVLMVITWIIPAAYFQSTLVEQGRVQMGLFDLFNYPATTLTYFGYVSIFILLVGGFYAVLNKTGAYRKLLDKIVSIFKGEEKLALAAIMVLIAIGVSVCGLQLALLMFFPLIIALILLMGYDKIVAALATVGSVTVGLMGTTFAYNITGVLNQIFTTDVYTEIITKVVILVLGLIILIFNTIKYIDSKKGKKSKDAKELEYLVPKEEKDSKKKKVWPLVVVLDLIFIITVLAFISWDGAFSIDIFTKAQEAVTKFEIQKFAIFGKLLGNVNAFGNWTVAELEVVLVIASIILALVYKIKFSEYIDTMIEGAKKAFKPALLVALIYTCLVITTYHPFQLIIYDWFYNLTKGFNVATTTIVAALAGLFNVDGAYSFQSAAPYLQSLVSDQAVYPLITIIFQTMYGLVMLIAPTSVVLMVTLDYLEISYKEWLKNVWKLALELLVVLVIIFTVLLVI